MDKENILYYQSNIKTSRDEDTVYAMKYADQQMLIDKLEQQCKKQKEVIDKVRKLIEKHYYKESDDYYDYFTEGVCLQDGDYNELEDILKEV